MKISAGSAKTHVPIRGCPVSGATVCKISPATRRKDYSSRKRCLKYSTFVLENQKYSTAENFGFGLFSSLRVPYIAQSPAQSSPYCHPEQLKLTSLASGLAATLAPGAAALGVGATTGAAATGSGSGTATGAGSAAAATAAAGAAPAEKSWKAATSSAFSISTIMGVPTATSGVPAGTRILASTASS